jgi:hypothetical protein
MSVSPRAACGVTPLKGAMRVARQSRFHRILDGSPFSATFLC